MKETDISADFVVVGAGSAGCALAYRLSASGASVIIIEYGGSDIGPFIQMPAALSFPMNMKRYDWGYSTEPEFHLGDRSLVTPRGKVIGGSSSINGMVYVRGHAKDFDGWEKMGATGWSFADVLPYFKRMEHWHGSKRSDDKNWRGETGPLHVSRGPRKNPLYHAFVVAGKEAGYELTDDYNGYKQEGFGPMEQTVYRGRRWSAANAYLRPALKRKNCNLVHGLVTRVVFEGTQAIGVEIKCGKQLKTIYAKRAVVLSAGSINSPKILMQSGVGPAQHLRDHGIKVISDRPAVGKNLQDHLELYIQMAASQPVTLYKYWNLASKAMIGAQWLFLKMGLGGSNQFESAAFIRSRAGMNYPDIQYHFLPMAVRYDGKAAAEGHGFQAHVGPMRSKSRGEVKLKSSDPHEAPSILFNYMSHPQDWVEFRNCIRLTREIFSQPAFQPYIKHEIQPGMNVQSDEELDSFIKDEVESAFHPCGTCRMGDPSSPKTVVSPDLKVMGVEGLYVADSSIFPKITNGNLNAPSIMVGEKAADHILAKGMLEKDMSKVWESSNWRTEQR